MCKFPEPKTFELIKEFIASESSLKHIAGLFAELENNHRQRIPNNTIQTFPIYRGEPQMYETTLLPSIFRNPEKFNDISFETNIFNRYLSNHPVNITRLAQLGRMQHYGFPTRLLDWSKNINIALYFAVFNNLDMDGVVYLFLPSLSPDNSTPTKFFNETRINPYLNLIDIPHNNINQLEYWRKGFSGMTNNTGLQIPWCFILDNNIFSNDVNVRQSVQNAFFTFHVGYMDGNQYRIIPNEIQNEFGINFILQTVSRVVIPARLKRDIVINLLDMNISTRTLFPEVPVYNEVEYSLTPASRI